MARVGHEPAQLLFARLPGAERGGYVIEQRVERLAHLADLCGGVSIARVNAVGQADGALIKRNGRDLGCRAGDAVERPQRKPHDEGSRDDREHDPRDPRDTISSVSCSTVAFTSASGSPITSDSLVPAPAGQATTL